MRKVTLSAIAAILLVDGIAYGQVALPMQPVQANRIVMRIDADQWKNVLFQADTSTFENGAMRLSGNVRISVQGHLMAADTAIISPDLLTLQGNARVVPSSAR